MERTLLLGLALLVALLLILERRRHDASLRRIPLRILVTGTRGKSTVVRLIAAGLRRSGRRTVAKTTGSAARLILEDGSEVAVDRPGAPTIREQQHFLAWAARRRVDAVVLECMAIRSDYLAAAGRLIQPHITAVTNTRPDHLEVIDADPTAAARGWLRAVPRHGLMVTGERTHLTEMEEAARARVVNVIAVDPSRSPPPRWDELFEENLALARTVCQLAGVVGLTREDLRGAAADPGALRIFRLASFGRSILAISAFAANEPVSTTVTLEQLRARGLLPEPIVFVYNHRDDRPRRAAQFAAYLATQGFHSLGLVGEAPGQMHRLCLRAGIAPERIRIPAGDPARVTEALAALLPAGGSIVGVGNFRGMGERLTAEWARRGRRDD